MIELAVPTATFGTSRTRSLPPLPRSRPSCRCGPAPFGVQANWDRGIRLNDSIVSATTERRVREVDAERSTLHGQPLDRRGIERSRTERAEDLVISVLSGIRSVTLKTCEADRPAISPRFRPKFGDKRLWRKHKSEESTVPASAMQTTDPQPWVRAISPTSWSASLNLNANYINAFYIPAAKNQIFGQAAVVFTVSFRVLPRDAGKSDRVHP